jgi:hypothetical protein
MATKKKTVEKDVKPKPEGYVFGRPTKYRGDHHPQSLVDYFSKEPTREIEKVIRGKSGDFTATEIVAEEFPTFAGWCASEDVDDETVSAWAAKFPDFSVAYKKAKQLQEAFLVENAIQSRYNPAFSIFFAKNNLGYRDKSEQELSGSVGSYTVETVDYASAKDAEE